MVLVFKAAAVWTLIVGLAFCNAALRELVLIPWFGKVRGLSASGVILALLVLLVACASVPWLGAARPSEWIAIGLGWCVLTIGFDLVLGSIQGKPVRELLDAYLFKGGNLWPLVLVVTAGAPYLAAKLRGWM